MKLQLLAGVVALGLSGCASIMNGATQPVTILSAPDSATVSVTNRAGQTIHSGVTPTTVTLKRGAGYFKPEVYTITLAKEGFTTREIKITGSTSGWYIGNLLFGGLIGMLAVDPSTGAMYNLPETVDEKLEATATKVSKAGDTLTIVSTDSLSAEQMQRAKLLVAAAQ